MASTVTDRPQLYRVSWGALFAGLFFGLGAWLLLLALGAGIELAKFEPRNLGNLQGLSLGVGIWSIASGVVAMFFAGWMAARLSASTERLQGVLHGAALWGLMIAAGLWVATAAVAKVASGAASGAAADEGAQGSVLRLQGQPSEGLSEGDGQANGDPIARAAAVGGATGAWAFFVFGALTLAAAAVGGAAGVPGSRTAIAREEPVPVAPNRPPEPQRA